MISVRRSNAGISLPPSALITNAIKVGLNDEGDANFLNSDFRCSSDFTLRYEIQDASDTNTGGNVV